MKKILLTGATGFVGRAVLTELACQNVSITCVIRKDTADRLPNGDWTIIEAEDMFSKTEHWWAKILKGHDIILHLAWYSVPGEYLNAPQNLVCLSGTLNLAKAAAKCKVSRFVGVGTCFEYDLSAGELTIDTPLRPQTTYAAAKAATFLTLDKFLRSQGISFLWARLFYLYGAGEDARRLVAYLHQKMQKGEVADLTSGNQIRDYMNVADAAKMLLDDTFGTIQGPTNIASGKGITVRELAETIADGYGRRDLLNFGARAENLTDPPCVIGLR